jgi:predicted RNase H-like HicB family nuclease
MLNYEAGSADLFYKSAALGPTWQPGPVLHGFSMAESRRRKPNDCQGIAETRGDGYFVANCASLKSCWSQGKTREEAMENIREAIALYLELQPSGFARNKTNESQGDRNEGRKS